MQELKIGSVDVMAVNVPMARPLVTGGGAVESAPLVLINLECGGIRGSSYVFCYTPRALGALHNLATAIAATLTGEPVRPLDVFKDLRKRFRLLGNQGLVAMACAGIDMALWDVAAKSAGLPLYRLLGGGARALPAYNSNGLGIIGPTAAGKEARELAAPGFSGVKLRLGYPTAAEDLAVANTVLDALKPGTSLMVDYNQCLTPVQAIQRMRLLDDTGIDWLEEPTLAEDYAGHARIRASCKTPVQLGENCWGTADMKHALDAGACDYFMPDAVKIGGVSGWLAAAALGDSAGVPISSHLFPEISAHLLTITPTAHWLEYVDWAEPVLATPLDLNNGMATPGDQPGNGVEFDAGSVEKYRVRI